MKKLFPLLLLIVFACKHNKETPLFVRNNSTQNIFQIDSVPEKKVLIFICDEHLDRASRDYDGNWTIEGDVKKVLEQIYQDYIMKQYATHCTLGIDTGHNPKKHVHLKQHQRKINRDSPVSNLLFQYNLDGSFRFARKDSIIPIDRPSNYVPRIFLIKDTTNKFNQQ